MTDVGTEPQFGVVSVYHASKLAPVARGEKDDLYLKDGKVVVLGVEALEGETKEEAEAKAEFMMDETYASGTTPNVVAQSALQPMAAAAVHGVNGLLLVLGATSSGKAQMVHGLDAAEAERVGASAWSGLIEELIDAIYVAMPSDSLSVAEERFSLRMQFVSIVQERVQDLLQPNCHAHDLKIIERAGHGCEILGADEVRAQAAPRLLLPCPARGGLSLGSPRARGLPSHSVHHRHASRGPAAAQPLLLFSSHTPHAAPLVPSLPPSLPLPPNPPTSSPRPLLPRSPPGNGW
jgi:hypothetical protein